LNASGFFTLEDNPIEGAVRVMRTPTDWSESPPGTLSPAPQLGQHSAEVLREAGYTEAQITELAQCGVTLLA
jgi:crotonobetainyl-CoA:carnitine CoA-transferase CaiB-like acyl-CoA transferase